MNEDIAEQCQQLLYEGHKPAEIARAANVSRKAVYRLLKRETKDYEPPARVSQVWRGARAQAVQLLVRLGIENKELATFFAVHPATISRWRHAAPGGAPILSLEVLDDCTLPNGELLPTGVYRVFGCSNREVICLRDENEGRLYFVPDRLLWGKVRLTERARPCHEQTS